MRLKKRLCFVFHQNQKLISKSRRTPLTIQSQKALMYHLCLAISLCFLLIVALIVEGWFGFFLSLYVYCFCLLIWNNFLSLYVWLSENKEYEFNLNLWLQWAVLWSLSLFLNFFFFTLSLPSLSIHRSHFLSL